MLAYREFADAIALTEVAEDTFQDSRTDKNGWQDLTGEFRHSVFGRHNGYEDVNDADRPARDPAMGWIVGGEAVKKRAVSTSQMGRTDTNVIWEVPVYVVFGKA